MKSYYISYGSDGINWVDISKLFSANVDKYTHKRNDLPDIVLARFMRLRPQAWQNQWAALRFDLIGCPLPSE